MIKLTVWPSEIDGNRLVLLLSLLRHVRQNGQTT